MISVILLNYVMQIVSVPIWGLFNLTIAYVLCEVLTPNEKVSVPIWGLFNLTRAKEKDYQGES